jgi:biopolymer transport protein ExbD
MARRSILQEEDATEIDLSPMIDCIFILLIFFIVTTVFVEEKGMAVNKPDAAAPAAVEESENVVIEITADDKILFQGKQIGLSDVGARVKADLNGAAETPVVIRANEKARHGTFVAVWDATKRGGAEALSFSTVD